MTEKTAAIESIEQKVASFATNGASLESAFGQLRTLKDDPAARDRLYEQFSSGEYPGLDYAERSLLRAAAVLDRAFRDPVDTPEDIAKALQNEDISGDELDGRVTIRDVLLDSVERSGDPDFIKNFATTLINLSADKVEQVQALFEKVATKDTALALAVIGTGFSKPLAVAVLGYTFREAPVTSARLLYSYLRGNEEAQAKHLDKLMDMSGRGVERAGILWLTPVAGITKYIGYKVGVAVANFMGVKLLKGAVKTIAAEGKLSEFQQSFRTAVSDPSKAIGLFKEAGRFIQDVPNVVAISAAAALNEQYANLLTRALDEMAKRGVFQYGWKYGFEAVRGRLIEADHSPEMQKIADEARAILKQEREARQEGGCLSGANVSLEVDEVSAGLSLAPKPSPTVRSGLDAGHVLASWRRVAPGLTEKEVEAIMRLMNTPGMHVG